MSNLTNLVRKYKQTKSKKLLNQIFILVEKDIKKKATYIFYQQKFRINKQLTKLSQTNKIELEDIEQELRLEVLKLIEKYNARKPFENYFYSTLQYWFPEFIRINNKRENFGIQTESELINEGEEVTIFDNLTTEPIRPKEELNLDKMFKNLTKQEKKLLNLMIKFPQFNQSELANRLGVTQQYISELLIEIKKKYK